MSNVYDNWERLVEATWKRENLRQLALCSSFSSSCCSSDYSQSLFSDFEINSHHLADVPEGLVKRLLGFVKRLLEKPITSPHILEKSILLEVRKVVLAIAIHDDKGRQKVFKSVSRLSGVESISLNIRDMKLTVVGDVDPIQIASKLRKLCSTEIQTVGPATSKRTRQEKGGGREEEKGGGREGGGGEKERRREKEKRE